MELDVRNNKEVKNDNLKGLLVKMEVKFECIFKKILLLINQV